MPYLHRLRQGVAGDRRAERDDHIHVIRLRVLPQLRQRRVIARQIRQRQAHLPAGAVTDEHQLVVAAHVLGFQGFVHARVGLQRDLRVGLGRRHEHRQALGREHVVPARGRIGIVEQDDVVIGNAALLEHVAHVFREDVLVGMRENGVDAGVQNVDAAFDAFGRPGLGRRFGGDGGALNARRLVRAARRRRQRKQHKTDRLVKTRLHPRLLRLAIKPGTASDVNPILGQA